jgi:phosphomannomutase
MKGFKAYDIRGVYNKDFNKQDVYKLGFFLPDLTGAEKILVGRDVRVSSEEIFENFVKGITDRGVDVYDIGKATTPMVYFGSGKHQFKTSVQITASHNPKEYNGFKISGENVIPIGYENGLNKLEELVNQGNIQLSEKKGSLIPFDLKADYLAFLKKYITEEIFNLHIGIDCSNGMAGLLIKDLLGEHPEYIHCEPDGTFPNHEPNPLDPKNQHDIKRLVLQNGCDIGVIFDGDGDRVMFIDELGNFISPDLIIALMGHYFLENPDEKVLQDIRTSKSVKEYLKKYNAHIHTWRVGRAFAAPKLREIQGVYGGELAGHYYFRDFYYSDSGLLAALIVLNITAEYKQKGIPLSAIIEQISNYRSSGELNFKIEDKKAAMETLKDLFIQQEQPLEVLDFDGYRLEFADWWFNVRPSNTEPYLRLIVEATNEQTLKQKLEVIKSALKPFE